ncbi:thiamine phosphate synthase [Planctomycetes bacterium CA13]
MNSSSLRAIYRILDASINRATEGVRTLEEFARFDLEDSKLTESFKTIRHDLSTSVNRFLSRDQLLASRDTPGDVGTKIENDSEYERADASGVVAAAASRVQQSLRVIEEYGKTIDAALAKEVEQIRYRAYHHCASLELRVDTSDRLGLLRQSRLYFLIDAHASEEAFVLSIRGLSDAGVDIFQLRDKAVDDRTLYSRSVVAAKIARGLGRLFIVNDRPDIAVAADADGVHVGQEELPISIVRSMVGPRRIVGLSTHSVDLVDSAESGGADYIGCGPVFSSRTKQFDQYAGTEFLKQVASRSHLPAFAIGGIDLTNLSQVIDAGFNRVAVTGAIRDAEHPLLVARQIKSQLL